MYKILVFIVYPWFRLFCHFSVIGKENIPKGKFVLIANHTAYRDPVILACSMPKKVVRFVAKSDLTRFAFYRWLFKAVKIIGINRGGNDITAMKTCISAIDSGDNVGIFPQGTRIQGEEPDVDQCMAGLGLMLAHTGVDVLPVAIKYPHNLPGGRKIKVSIGKVITKEEYMAPDEDGEEPRRKEIAIRCFRKVCQLHEKL